MEKHNLEERLLEADEVIKAMDCVEKAKGFIDTSESIREMVVLRDAYADKYLKPKDELFEKWNNAPKEIFQNFGLFSDYFKEELKGTKGLDEAIDWTERAAGEWRGSVRDSYNLCTNYLKEIKERMENPSNT